MSFILQYIILAISYKGVEMLLCLALLMCARIWKNTSYIFTDKLQENPGSEPTLYKHELPENKRHFSKCSPPCCFSKLWPK